MRAVFKIFVDRGNGLESDGAWTDGNNQFDDSGEAWKALETLAEEYMDVDWVLTQDEQEIMRKYATILPEDLQ